MPIMPDYTLILRTDELIQQRDEARRWSKAWKAAAKRWHGEYLECFDDFLLLDELLDEAREWARKMKAENQRLRELIKQVVYRGCPWCGYDSPNHSPLCPALDL